MNTGFSSLLIASLAGLMLSGQAAAGPRYLDGDFTEFAVRADRAERNPAGQEEREMRKAGRQPNKKEERKAADQERDRGYGYGYERRNLQPPPDDRGRR